MANATTNSVTWSICSNQTSLEPLLTSLSCYDSLVNFFQNESSQVLAVTTESSSHVSGLNALYAQPWVYGGGGLGNMDECPLEMQVCLAGGTKRDSLTFAAVCVVPECTAHDLASPDFPARLETASFRVETTPDQDIILEYVTLHQRIAQVNKFLNTGWVCGEYVVAWEIVPSTIYLGMLCSCILLSIVGTFKERIRLKKLRESRRVEFLEPDEEKKDAMGDEIMASSALGVLHKNKTQSLSSSFWFPWDIRKHLKKLCVQRRDTACLDGLKVGSILWVILGHVLAIQSSSGPGYLNPASFLPPVGITTTLIGQLLFSSRFAVDTFLCISGYLVVHVLKKKLRPPYCPGVGWILLFRILRILPLYCMCLGFWVYIAPHLGSGPFWYQWENFLEPCRQFGWTNLLFVNNFLPWGQPTTDTCFYHSWYLAVDVQLFCLLAPWIAILHGKSQVLARRMTIFLWICSVSVTAALTFQRKWSVNTFDGIAVALFDVEGYAKPHVRAQSYLAGMLVAMLPHSRPRPSRDFCCLALVLITLAILSFVTVTGAYARRACNFSEIPFLDDCGSLWGPRKTFLYTGFSRAIWSICIGAIIHLCVQGRGMAVGAMLSWSIWTPLAHLSFGVYLIHPILIFVWQLGGKEKISFRLLSFLMDFTSISVVSFVLSAFVTLTVEFPFSEILRPKQNNRQLRTPQEPDSELIPVLQYSSRYGSVTNGHTRME